MGGYVPKDIGAPTQPHRSALGFPSNYAIWKEIPLLPRKETPIMYSLLFSFPLLVFPPVFFFCHSFYLSQPPFSKRTCPAK